MDKQRVGAAMIIALLIPLIGWAESPAAGQATTVPGLLPAKIEFVYPHANDKFSDYPIQIETKVTNCSLELPVQYWGAVTVANAARGHIHYTLDDSPIFATRSTKVTMLKPQGKSLPIGKHILRAELVYINHENRNPRVYAEIPIYCERPNEKGNSESSESIPMDKRTRQELQEMENQLTDVQKKLYQLKIHSHEAPNP